MTHFLHLYNPSVATHLGRDEMKLSSVLRGALMHFDEHPNKYMGNSALARTVTGAAIRPSQFPNEVKYLSLRGAVEFFSQKQLSLMDDYLMLCARLLDPKMFPMTAKLFDSNSYEDGRKLIQEAIALADEWEAETQQAVSYVMFKAGLTLAK